MSSKDAVQIRRSVHKMNTTEDLFSFVEQYKDERKIYAFCFYAFLEKLILTSPNTAQEFVNVCKEKQVGDIIVKLMTNMLNSSKKETI